EADPVDDELRAGVGARRVHAHHARSLEREGVAEGERYDRRERGPECGAILKGRARREPLQETRPGLRGDRNALLPGVVARERQLPDPLIGEEVSWGGESGAGIL